MTSRPEHHGRRHRRRRHRAPAPPIQVHWHEGERNEAWEELWRRILGDVLRKADDGASRHTDRPSE